MKKKMIIEDISSGSTHKINWASSVELILLVGLSLTIATAWVDILSGMWVIELHLKE